MGVLVVVTMVNEAFLEGAIASGMITYRVLISSILVVTVTETFDDAIFLRGQPLVSVTLIDNTGSTVQHSPVHTRVIAGGVRIDFPIQDVFMVSARSEVPIGKLIRELQALVSHQTGSNMKGVALTIRVGNRQRSADQPREVSSARDRRHRKQVQVPYEELHDYNVKSNWRKTVLLKLEDEQLRLVSDWIQKSLETILES